MKIMLKSLQFILLILIQTTLTVSLGVMSTMSPLLSYMVSFTSIGLLGTVTLRDSSNTVTLPPLDGVIVKLSLILIRAPGFPSHTLSGFTRPLFGESPNVNGLVVCLLLTISRPNGHRSRELNEEN